MAAQFAVGTHFARHARHFRRKGTQLIHHRIDGFFELENFAAHIDGDLARQVAAGNRRRYFGNVSHLAGKVAGHRVDGVGQILPRAGHAGDQGLATQLAVRAHLARHARHFGREDAELLNHGVDDVGGAQKFAFERSAVHVETHRLGQVTLGDGRDGPGDFGGWAEKVFDQRVYRNFHLAPRTSATS